MKTRALFLGPLLVGAASTAANAASVTAAPLVALQGWAANTGGQVVITAVIGIIVGFMFMREELQQLMGHLSKWVIGGALLIGVVAFAGFLGIGAAAGAWLR